MGRKKSNAWTGVPVDANNEKETSHDHLDDVVTVVCNNLDDRTVHQFRVSDLASVRKAQAVPEGYVVVPMEPTEQILNRMTNAPIEVNHLCDNADIFLSEDEARIAYKAMIEAQEQKG